MGVRLPECEAHTTSEDTPQVKTIVYPAGLLPHSQAPLTRNTKIQYWANNYSTFTQDFIGGGGGGLELLLPSCERYPRKSTHGRQRMPPAAPFEC